ncbi:FtsX-like permease family protein [Gordonia sp. (in: high G+C Gram-positive bacteria)]|uniref:FtsX-like permease family protein n=1 Tax=Gordonia sp. (in: high G+C Gram-positive bacteria) TaxID=84139 RepID=UPI002630019A|nr:FtsX-like permease family protein [Gordonia sp. (in: high G+C Gram-positive bacteria)]
MVDSDDEKEMPMYIGLREIRRAAGRFGLMVGVIALLSFLVVALSALTGGLRDQSVSAVEELPGAAIAVQKSAGSAVGLVDSRLSDDDVARLRADDPGAQPLGIAMSGVGHGVSNSAVAVFGRVGAAAGVRLNSETAAALGVRPGDAVSVGGVPARVASVGDTGMFAHSPVAEVPIGLWRQAAHRDDSTAVLLTREVTGIDGVAVVTGSARLDLIPGYSSEHGSLLLIQGLLLVISAVVVGAFFAVWTGQRLPSLAVVRAMGASRWYLVRDGLGQAAVVLGAGLVVGAAAGAGVAFAADGAVPIALTVGGVALPVVAMAVLGLLGAVLALRPLTSVDPLTALNR